MTQKIQETYLGLDIGTSSVKALLIGADQRVVAEASAPLSVQRPHPLWSEQDPEDWFQGVEAAVSAIRRHAHGEFEALAGVGLSGQMHGATLLGADDRPLRPTINGKPRRCRRGDLSPPRSNAESGPLFPDRAFSRA